MTTIKINEQIAFLRKQKGLTQEELANALGVTNQAVSKWESAQCCPDIQLLPDLAKIFDVSIDELIGYKSTEGLGDICLKIKEHFSALPEKKAFENAYRIAALLHEIASTDGYKKTVPWKEKDYAADFDLFVTTEQIATAAFLKEEEVETALRELPLTVKEEDGTYKYRLDGASAYLPPLLSFLYKL